jgi:hypothetical protein
LLLLGPILSIDQLTHTHTPTTRKKGIGKYTKMGLPLIFISDQIEVQASRVRV